MDNLEHVVDKHDKDIAELRKEIGAKIEYVYLKENDQPLPATFSLLRSIPTTQIPEIYNPVGDETEQVFAGVYHTPLERSIP